MGLHQWTKPPEPVRVTLSNGQGVYVNAMLTFDQNVEPKYAEALLRSPHWYVIPNESTGKQG